MRSVGVGVPRERSEQAAGEELRERRGDESGSVGGDAVDAIIRFCCRKRLPRCNSIWAELRNSPRGFSLGRSPGESVNIR